jgi:hypothetical protein
MLWSSALVLTSVVTVLIGYHYSVLSAIGFWAAMTLILLIVRPT